VVLRYKKPTTVALYFLFFFKHTPAQYQNEASTALCTFVFPVVPPHRRCSCKWTSHSSLSLPFLSSWSPFHVLSRTAPSLTPSHNQLLSDPRLLGRRGRVGAALGGRRQLLNRRGHRGTGRLPLPHTKTSTHKTQNTKHRYQSEHMRKEPQSHEGSHAREIGDVVPRPGASCACPR